MTTKPLEMVREQVLELVVDVVPFEPDWKSPGNGRIDA